MNQNTLALAPFAMAVALMLAGCVEQASNLPGAPRVSTAGPGAEVMRVNHTEPLPNLFGGNDLFGRTRDTGTTIVYLVSTSGGAATFRRQDVDIISSKDTVNTSATVIPTGNKASDVIVLPAFTPKDHVGAVREMTFTLKPNTANNSITIDGHILTVLQVKSGLLTYSAN